VKHSAFCLFHAVFLEGLASEARIGCDNKGEGTHPAGSAHSFAGGGTSASGMAGNEAAPPLPGAGKLQQLQSSESVAATVGVFNRQQLLAACRGGSDALDTGAARCVQQQLQQLVVHGGSPQEGQPPGPFRGDGLLQLSPGLYLPMPPLLGKLLSRNGRLKSAVSVAEGASAAQPHVSNFTHRWVCLKCWTALDGIK
jgi:hypothetical protein